MRGKSEKILVELLDGPKGFGVLLGTVKNRRTLSYTLKELLELNLIQRRGKDYELTEKGEGVATRLAEISKILGAETPDVERVPHPIYRGLIRKYCNLLLGRFGERLESVVLFGSVARGRWREDSDIDLLVVADGFEDPMGALDELIDAKLELKKTPEYKLALEKGFHPSIQHYPLSQAELSRMPRILLDIVFDGITIYDKGGFKRAAEMLREKLKESGSYRVEFSDGRWYWVLGGEI